MAKGIFVTGTGTDVGKTYVTALIVKKLADAGIHAGYYKAALSGAESIEESDAGYVKKIAVSHRKTAAYCHICIKMRCLRIWLPE